MVPRAEAHRRLDHDYRRVDVLRRQVPGRRDDERAGADECQRFLRSRGPIFIRQIDAFDRKSGEGVANRVSCAIAFAPIGETHIPIQGRRRGIGNRWIGRIPQAARR